MEICFIRDVIMDYIVSDIEGTLTTGSSWKAIRSYYKANFSAWRYNRFFLNWVPRYLMVALGFYSRKQAISKWMEEEAALFRDIPRQDFKRMADWVVEVVMWPKRRKNVLKEIKRVRQDGAQVLVVSSGYQPIVEAFAERMDAIPIGTPLKFKSDRIEGISYPVNAYEHKAARIRKETKSGTILVAYGDTISDLSMLELSQSPVVVSPDQKLRKIAEGRGWRIIEEQEGEL